MRDHYERATTSLLPQHIDDGVAVRVIERRGRFVGEDRFRRSHECPRHAYPLPFSAAQFVGEAVHLVAEPQARESVLGLY
ncbi:MAG TPA: hypothetical protein PLL78_11915 [Fimbriimonadaceae bacterium]|nr:hypothetical protein [Fimbriimonadaceae bacterium]HRJ97380.1 hypothetical protein [Fimbriimonadaceae bacterium]